MTLAISSKKKLIVLTAFFTIAPSIVYAGQTPPQRTEAEGFPPVVKTVYVDRIVYVDRPVTNTVYVNRVTARTTEVPVTKVIKIEVPVYETQTVTSDPKTIRAMMKVTHDRYIALLAMYRALKAHK